MSRVRDALLHQALELILRWRSRRSLVRAALRGRELPRAPTPSPGKVRVAAIQFRLRLVSDAGQFAAALAEPLQEAVAQRAELAIFPEAVGVCLLGLLPGVEALLARASSLGEAVTGAGGEDATVADLFRSLGPGARRAYNAAFSELARRLGLHIVAGSLLLPDETGQVYNEATLFGPAGRVIGSQRKTHLFPVEQEWGIADGDEIRVFDTPVGRLAFPICMDHTFFEPQRIAWLLGAEILIDPSGNPAEYHPWEQQRGVWGRVQESPAYGVLASLVGSLLDITFEGRSGIYAPLELTPEGDGIVAQADSADRQEVVVADLDLEALARFRRESAPAFNLPLLERYLPQAYEAYRRAQPEGRRIVRLS